MRETVLASIERHERLVDELAAGGVDTIIAAAEVITECIRGGGCIYICGNGGSAADAQHIAGELVGRFLRERKGIAAVALTTDTSVITSIANDYDFADIFRRQVEALVREGDVLWAFSTSGESGNVISAAELAKEKGARVIGFTGRKSSSLEKMADVCLAADAETSAAAQEVHQVAYHIICDLVEQELCKD